MPQTGQTYIVTFQNAHLNWGTLRYTGSREPIEGEAYIQIPANIAYGFEILKGSTYNCVSSDGSFATILRASGNQADARYAKQFESDGNLKILGNWLFNVCHAQVGDSMEVRWSSPHDIILTYCPQ